MKIAIVGSGIAGLTCAHLLNRRHDITVFEASDWVGGHTHTVQVTVDGREYHVDTGFIVFNDWTYPNFIRLLGQLGVSFKPTEMSFSVTDPDSGLEYNGNNLNSLFAQRSNLLSPGFWGMLRDILRFNKEARRDLAEQRIAADTTLDDYLKAGGYGERFILHYIVPMGSAIWSMPMAEMLNFPLQFFVRFFKNHGLLSVSDRPQWQVIEGGSSAYLAPLTAAFKEKPIKGFDRMVEELTQAYADIGFKRGRSVIIKMLKYLINEQKLIVKRDNHYYFGYTPAEIDLFHEEE